MTTPAPLSLLDPDDATLRRLHDRLERDAHLDGLLDLAYTTVPTPVGELLLVSSAEGLLRVAFDLEDHGAVLTGLAARVGPRVLRSDGRLADATRQVEEYFAGRRRSFDLALDLRLVSGFRLDVVRHLREIGYGSTESYAEVAAATGRPAAVRAVGTACGHNPLPVVVPCHRVVRSDGTSGGYLGGPAAKDLLLSLERSAA
ncbi:MAG TPA: methylated-DNA--[protein]-cysteine S-methyltransferase [Marmoricola sp.]|nr:methylated-DNA--[protein]-cysteine S-methyltransferase [Marmoricola sp.]